MAQRGSSFPSTSHVSVKRRKSDFILLPMFQTVARGRTRPSSVETKNWTLILEDAFEPSALLLNGLDGQIVYHPPLIPSLELSLQPWLEAPVLYRLHWRGHGRRLLLPHPAVQRETHTHHPSEKHQIDVEFAVKDKIKEQATGEI